MESGQGGAEEPLRHGVAVMYEEKLPRRWTLVTVTVLTVWVVHQGAVLLPEESTVFLVILAFTGLLALVLNAVPLSKRVYHRIRLQGGQLTVGRETIAVDSLSSDSVLEAREQPSDAEFAASLAGRSREELAEIRRKSRTASAPRLVGGGWSVPLGMEEVVVETVGGESLLIATHDRGALLDALARACRT
ncbi:hypothetical protein G3I18_35885 [Actinospica acidiphila]|uniref:Uncharacterized protein n=2 Tax=Actinomycetes TaxID=1760 RepID=A0A9X5HGK2_9ACTN|nr:hypothetical protein [Actinospica acidiphila]NEC53885.1 hypothetical protein [Actinospica acidiphila]